MFSLGPGATLVVGNFPLELFGLGAFTPDLSTGRSIVITGLPLESRSNLI